jgi:hypothetical protein
MYPVIKKITKTEEISIVNSKLHSNQYKDIQVNITPQRKTLPTQTKYPTESQK